MSGAGTFNTQSKSVKVTGTFTHRSSNGNVVETGVWISTDLVSFDSYGVAPNALLQRGSAFGPPPFGPKRLPMSSGRMPTGGLAVFRVRFLPMRGASTTAVLQATALREMCRMNARSKVFDSLWKRTVPTFLWK
jgi:hypothetical protein